ncbi:MAG: hypothetical protein L6R36_006053 [Xanthoria steineri]|nr:MAG: hypothetical protein L6R36_006053 [Xanthoria steineri]
MQSNTVTIAGDGECLTITFHSFVVTIPAPEGPILCLGERLPCIIDLDNCPGGFHLHDTENRVILSYKDNVASLESPVEIVEGTKTVNDTERVNEEDEQRVQHPFTPTRPRSASEALFFPFKTPPRPSSLTKSSSAASSSRQAIPPITPPEGAPKLREVPIQRSGEKAMWASERYRSRSPDDNTSASINHPQQQIFRSFSFTTPSPHPPRPSRTPATMPRRRSSTSAAATSTTGKKQAPSLKFHPVPPVKNRIPLWKRESSAPVFHSPWNEPGNRAQLTTAYKGTANLHRRSQQESNGRSTLEEKNPISTGPTRRASRARARTPSPSPRRESRRERGVEMKGQLKRGSSTGMANYGLTGAWGKPSLGAKEDRGRNSSPPFGKGTSTKRHTSTPAFRSGGDRDDEGNTTEYGVNISSLRTRKNPQGHGFASSIPHDQRAVTTTKASNTQPPIIIPSTTTPPHSFPPSSKTIRASKTTLPFPTLLPSPTALLHLSANPAQQPPKRALPISPSLPSDLNTSTSTPKPSSTSKLPPSVKRRRSNAAPPPSSSFAGKDSAAVDEEGGEHCG